MDRGELERLILREIARRERQVERRERPPEWDRLAALDDEEERTYGPSYSPRWLGRLTETGAGYRRVVRAIHRLGRAGLVWITRTHDAGRFHHLRLTEEGRVAARARGPRRPKETA